MFNSEEIAKKALLRAEEIKADRKRRHKQAGIAIFGVSAMVMVAAIAIMPSILAPGVLIEDALVPLASPLLPDDNAIPYEGQLPDNQLRYSIPEYGKIPIPAGTIDVALQLLNPEENNCWLTFEIVLKDGGETLYTSGMVAPSMYIENITLAKALPRGEHPAKMIIRSYELESLAALGSVSVEVVLIAG